MNEEGMNEKISESLMMSCQIIINSAVAASAVEIFWAIFQVLPAGDVTGLTCC